MFLLNKRKISLHSRSKDTETYSTIFYLKHRQPESQKGQLANKTDWATTPTQNSDNCFSLSSTIAH